MTLLNYCGWLRQEHYVEMDNLHITYFVSPATLVGGSYRLILMIIINNYYFN